MESMEEAMLTLAESETIRNAIVGIPANAGAVCLDTLLATYCNNPELVKWITKSQPSGRYKQSKNRTREERLYLQQEVVLIIFKDSGILGYCEKEYQTIAKLKLFQDTVFLIGVVGQEWSCCPYEIEMDLIFKRLQIIEDYLVKKGWDMRSRSKLGLIWMPKLTLDKKEEILLQTESKWRQHMERIAKDGYLDVQAGIKVIPNMESPDAKGSGSCSSMRQAPVWSWTDCCFSPTFVRHFHDDVLPTLLFMKDPTSICPWPRFFRCESPLGSTQEPIYFQLGKPPRARLFQALQSSKFADHLLQIANFIEGKRHSFFMKRLKTLYGPKVASKLTPPRKTYDVLFGVVGHRSFGFHSDSNPFLFDDDLPGWEEKYMRVVTMFFQNLDDSLVDFSIREKAPPENVETVKRLGPHGVHEQGNFIQDRYVHSAIYNSDSPLHLRRCVWTARATQPCHDRGLTALREKQKSIRIHGASPYDYNVSGHDAFQPQSGETTCRPAKLQKVGPSPDASDSDSVSQNFSDSEHDSSRSEGSCTQEWESVSEDMKEADTDTSSDVVLPQSSGWIRYADPVVNYLMTPGGLGMLVAEKVTLVVIDRTHSKIPYAPPPSNSTRRFARIGESLRLHDVCHYYGLPCGGQLKPAWNTRPYRLNVLVLSKRYKAPLETMDSPLSPAVVARKLSVGEEQCKFSIYLSGGSGVELDPDSAGCSYMTPCRMKLHPNSRNGVMYEAAKRRSVVNVCFSGENLKHTKTKDGEPLCTYGGYFQLTPFESCPAMEPAAIKTLRNACLEYNLDGASVPKPRDLSFLRAQHYKCTLLPTHVGPVYGSNMGDWGTIEVAYDEPLMYPAPPNFSLDDFVTCEEAIPCPLQFVRRFVQDRTSNQ